MWLRWKYAGEMTKTRVGGGGTGGGVWRVCPGCPKKEHHLVHEGSPSVMCGHPGTFERQNIALQYFLSTPVRTVMPETRGAVNTGI